MTYKALRLNTARLSTVSDTPIEIKKYPCQASRLEEALSKLILMIFPFHSSNDIQTPINARIINTNPIRSINGISGCMNLKKALRGRHIIATHKALYRPTGPDMLCLPLQ